jgi:hypothetical protein
MLSIANTLLMSGRTWKPWRLSGCILALGPTAPSSPVATWADASPVHGNATQITAGNQPTYGTGPNGHGAVVFASASSQYLNLAASFAGAAGELFVVAKNANSGVNQGLFTIGNSGSQTMVPHNSGGVFDDFGQSSRMTCGTPAATLTNWYIYNVSAVAGAFGWTNRFNGTQLYQTTGGAVAWNAAPKLGLGIDQKYNGSIAMVLGYNRVLAPAERTKVKTWLAAWSGVTVA